MKIKYSQIVLLLVITITVFACKNDNYYLDGGLSSQSEQQKKLSTYDFLKQNAQGKFDSLIKIIDITNSKEIVNQNNITFYASPNNAIIKFQQRLTPSDKQKRNLDKVGVDTLKMLLNRFIVKGQRITLNDVIPNLIWNVKDNNQDSIKIIGEGGGLTNGANNPASAYRMRYSHMKIPKVDSVIYNAGIQTHNLITSNAVIHVLTEGSDFGCGLKVKNYR